MPSDTEIAEAPSIGDSISSFMENKPETAEPPETPPSPDPEPAKSPEEPKSDELDLSGAVEAKKPETKPETDDAEFEQYNRSLGAKPAKLVRQELFKTRKEFDRLKSEFETLKSQPRSDENRAALDAAKAELETYRKKMADVEATRDKLSKQLAKVDVANSPDFKERYEKPWQQAQEVAVNELSGFTKQNDEGEEVAIGWDDFDPILKLPIKDAVEKAKAILGDNWEIAITHRRNILNAKKEYREALERHEAESQNLAVERSKHEAAMTQLFESETKRLQSEYPDIYTPDSNNPREKEQFEKGSKIAQAAIFGLTGLTPEARIKSAAIAFGRAANFPILAIRNNDLKNENARLTKEIETLKNGLPGGGSGSSNGDSGSTEESLEASMESFRSGIRR